MALFIEITAPDGAVTRVAANGPTTQVDAQPGHVYRLISDDAGAPQPVAQVRRVDGDLVVELPENGQNIELTRFFTPTARGSQFSLAELGGDTETVITPQSEPVGALTSGGFLLWASPQLRSEPVEEPGSDLNWRPIAAIGGGAVLVAGAAAGGGSSAVASDRTPPSAPVINEQLNSNSPRPVITGTADPGTSITITIDAGDSGQRVTYTTTTDAAGNWSVDLANDTPFSGSLPEAGLPIEPPSTARIISTDAAGNSGPLTVGTITIDVTPPTETASVTEVVADAPAPVDANGNPTTAPGIEISPGVIAPGGQTNDGSPTITGTISGPLAQGDRVIIFRGDSAVGEATLEGLTWTFTDSNVPEGTFDYSARVTDLAGNGSVGGQAYTVTVDATAPAVPTIATISDDDTISFADAQQPVPVTGTADPGTRVSVTIGNVTQEASVAADGTYSVPFTANQLPGNGLQAVNVVSIDDFGNESPAATRELTIVTGLPTAPTLDTGEGSILAGPVAAINAAEAGDTISLRGFADPGNIIRVNLRPQSGGSVVTTQLRADSQGEFVATFDRAELPDGNYTAQVIAADTVGNLTNGPTLPIVVDTNVPDGQIRINSIVDNTGGQRSVDSGAVINDRTPTLVGQANGVGAGEFVEVTRDGALVGTTQVNNGNWSFTDSTLAEGQYVYQVNLSDVADNNGPSSEPGFVITIDATPPPAPVINTVAGNNIVTGSEAAGGVVITGSASAGAAVRVDWAGQVQTTRADGSGNWGVRYSNVPGDGNTQVIAQTADEAGNVATGTRSVLVDTTPPGAPQINTVEGDNRVNAAEASNGIQITGQAEAGATIDLLWEGSRSTATANGSGFWSVTFDSPPAQGGTTLRARAIDAGDNTSTTTTRDIQVDTVAPGTPTINTVEGDNTITFAEAANGIQITGRGEAGSSVRVDWAGSVQTATVNGAGNWGVVYGSAPAQGASVVRATASDAAGNDSGTASLSVTANTLPPPPAPSINTVAGDNVVNAAEAAGGITLSGNAQAGAQVAVSWGGFTGSTTANGGGSWTVNVPASQIPSGNATVSAVASNASGSGPAASLNVAIDLAAPAAPAIATVEGDNVIDFAEAADGVPVLGTAEAGSRVTVVWAGQTEVTTADGNGRWRVDFNSVPAAGDSTITARAQDGAGNVGPVASRTVTVDDTPPPPPAPSINTIAGDGVVNLAEATAGVVVSGTAQAGATVSVNWGGTTLQDTADGSGNYAVTFARAQVPTSDNTVTARAENAGGPSPVTTETVSVDVRPPARPSIAEVGDNGVISSDDLAGGLTVNGRSEPGSTVELTWENLTESVTADGAGNWQANFSSVPGQGPSIITAIASDAADNPSPVFSRNVVVDTTGPSQDVQITDVIDNVGPDRGSVDDGDTTDDTRPQLIIQLSSAPGAGDELQIIQNGQVIQSITDNDATFNYVTPVLPDGDYEFQARLVDSGGNLGTISSTYTITIDTTP
ncbi:MAG: Ig-like domain-containing protein [Burkholderiaceae bacterium]